MMPRRPTSSSPTRISRSIRPRPKAARPIVSSCPPCGRARRPRRGLGIELRRAYVQSEFELHFQPQIRLADNAVIGAEALLRWRHPERGLIAPGAFIDALAESSIAPEVGR